MKNLIWIDGTRSFLSCNIRYAYEGLRLAFVIQQVLIYVGLLSKHFPRSIKLFEDSQDLARPAIGD